MKTRAQKRVRDREITPTHIYVPKSFNPSASLPTELHRYADAARYFLHKIIWGKMMMRTTHDQFVPLKFDYLREVIPDRIIKPLKRSLIEAEMVEPDNHFIVGLKAHGFKLGPAVAHDRIVRYAITDTAIAVKVRANRDAQHKKIRLDVHKYLRQWLRRTEIDLPSALKALKDHPDIDLVKIPVEQIAAREFSFSVCRFGRVHTDLTRSPRGIRPTLSIGGERLVEIDIANSQPLFLALLLINFRKNGSKSFSFVSFNEDQRNPYHKIDEIIQKTILSFSLKEKEIQGEELVASITTRNENQFKLQNIKQKYFTQDAEVPDIYDCLKSDEQHFVSVCQQGKLYEGIMERLEINHRRTLKEMFFQYLYGNNRISSVLKADFRDVFPSVAEFIASLKRKDHAFLAQLLQNIESTFVINRVCRRLMNEIPDAPVLTIHDCLLTTSQFVDSVKDVINQEFEKLGLIPTLHLKFHGKATLKANAHDAS